MHIPDDLRRDIEDAIGIIINHDPDRAHEAGQLRRAMHNNSGILNTRFETLVDNSTPSGYTREEKQFLGEIMVRLEDLRSGGPAHPVSYGDDRTLTFRLRLTPDERARLEEMAAEAGETPSQFMRRRVFGE